MSSGAPTPEKPEKHVPTMAVLRTSLDQTIGPTQQTYPQLRDSSSDDDGPRRGKGGVRQGSARAKARDGKGQHGSSSSTSGGITFAGGVDDARGGPRQSSGGITFAAEPNPPHPKGNLPQGGGSGGTVGLVTSGGITFAGGGLTATAVSYTHLAADE